MTSMVLPMKFTAAGGQAQLGRGVWKPGVWRDVRGKLEPCVRGLHYCGSYRHAIEWLNVECWRFEDGTPDETIDHGNKLVTRKGRILERVETWNETTARLFAADCAEMVLPIFERELPGDRRPRQAIEASRLYARGELSAAARDAAWDAALAAASDAARAAGRDAARDAARSAALAAGRAAAWDAAWHAARNAAWAATWAAAEHAAGAAAWDAARAEQVVLLGEYLEGKRS